MIFFNLLNIKLFIFTYILYKVLGLHENLENVTKTMVVYFTDL